MPNEPLLDFIFRSLGRPHYEALVENDQAEVDRLVALLLADPTPDGRTKFGFPSQVVIRSVYDDDTWTIVYSVRGHVLEIWAIQRSDPEWRKRRGY